MVAGPRPSPARSARPRARRPSQAPPGAKSPDSSARAGKRTVRPSGPTAAQFIPVPQTTPMPQDDVVPARETANVSLRRIDALGPPERVDRRRQLLLVDGEVDAGQAVDAGRAERDEARGQRRVGGDRGDGLGQRGDRAVQADELMVARADAGPTEDGAAP